MNTDVAAAAHWLAVWSDDLAVVLLGCAAALFTVAGVVRLARWRLVADPHSALTGCALIVMGALCLPLVGIAEISGALQRRQLGEALARLIATAVTISLVIRAVRTTSASRPVRPSQLLPRLAVIVIAGFASLVAIEAALPEPVPGGSTLARSLSLGMVLGWLMLGVVVARLDPDRSWARRSVPLFFALAAAEALHGSDPNHAAGTAGGLVVCTIVAAFCVWSARIDLEHALTQTDRTIGSLSQTLHEVLDEAVELSEWRAHLLHDADNAVAGLRAALDVLDDRQAADPGAARLCHAAVEEVRHLDHLLHRSPEEALGPFEVGAVVRSVALTAQALGQVVTLRDRRATAVGRPGDLVVVLKNLLVNVARHAPGARVELTVEQRGDWIEIVCSDNGPGLSELVEARAFDRGFHGPASTGSGLGLYEARMLMQGQGGDLVLERSAIGARFVATLPATTAPLPRRARGIPAQRGDSPVPRPAFRGDLTR